MGKKKINKIKGFFKTNYKLLISLLLICLQFYFKEINISVIILTIIIILNGK